jgi:hypothetical protein
VAHEGAKVVANLTSAPALREGRPLEAAASGTAGRARVARICVVGLWHQGTVLAACFAELGHDVVGVDPDAGVVAGLREGRPPLHEPGLPELLKAGLAAGRLDFTTDLDAAVPGADLVYLSLDTPVGAKDGSDLEPVFAAARGHRSGTAGDVVLCVTAQVPVGTSEALARRWKPRAAAAVCRVVYVPEFLRLGTALDSFRQADRFLIGAEDAALAERVAGIYRPLGRPVEIDGRAIGRDDEARQQRLPGRVHQLHQRDRGPVRGDGRGRGAGGGGDEAGPPDRAACVPERRSRLCGGHAGP